MLLVFVPGWNWANQIACSTHGIPQMICQTYVSLLYSEDLNFSKLVAEVVYLPDNGLVLCRSNTSQCPAFDVASMEKGLISFSM